MRNAFSLLCALRAGVVTCSILQHALAGCCGRPECIRLCLLQLYAWCNGFFLLHRCARQAWPRSARFGSHDTGKGVWLHHFFAWLVEHRLCCIPNLLCLQPLTSTRLWGPCLCTAHAPAAGCVPSRTTACHSFSWTPLLTGLLRLRLSSALPVPTLATPTR